jgi:membrane-bound inhibitor of C-type lysozyme
MKIEWGRVTWYSQIIAVILFVGVFALGIWVGIRIERSKLEATQKWEAVPAQQQEKIIATVGYRCDKGKEILAVYKDKKVDVSMSDGRMFTLPQALSADGARYTSADELFVFWSKGQGAFITEGSSTTFANCNQVPFPISP